MRHGLFALCALAACADEVPVGSHLERTRVLAVAIAPTGDPTRAWPRAGEEAELSALVAAPGALPALSWHVELCAADASGACLAAPFVSEDGTAARGCASWSPRESRRCAPAVTSSPPASPTPTSS